MTRRLVVIDDADDMRELARFFLELDGAFAVTTAENATEGLTAARASRPDAILLDLMMPGIDGVEALEMIRADDSLRMLPVIILSGVVSGPELARAQTLGVQGIIAKPFDPARLAADVASMLARR